MKVTGIETLVLDNLPNSPGGRKWLFIKLATDEGIVGLGERVSGGVNELGSQVALLKELAEQFVIGENPFNIERIWQRMFAAQRAYAYLPVFPLPRDIQLKDLKHAAEIFRHIRDAVGDELEVGIGTHGQFSTAGAIRAAKVFEEYEPMWFEEPVPPEMVDELARVAAQTSIPIAAGERLATKYDFANLIEKQAAGIIQVDVGQCGGILEAKKIAAIAEAHHALIAPHMYVGPIGAAAAIQLDACSANFMIQEFNVGQLHADLFVEPIRVVNGYITPPTGPGLGLVLNDEVVRRHLSQ